VQALTDLGLAAPLQLGQFTNTAAYGGLGRSMRAFAQLTKKGQYETQMLKAMRTGALNPDVAMEIIGKTSDDLPLFKNERINKFMYGVNTMDKAMRVHAYTVGEFMLNEAKAGDKGAAKMVKDLGLDLGKTSADEVGRTLSDKTQFRTGPGEIPLWASSPFGRMVFQYKNFAYRYTAFARGMVKDAMAGNPKPLAVFLAAGAPAGEIVNDIRSALKGRSLTPEEKDTPWNDKKWEENLKAAFTTRRIPLTSPGMRLLQNYLTIGGIGILQPYLESVMQAGGPRSLAKFAGGPVASNVEDLVVKSLGEGPKGGAKWLTQQVPVFGYDISKEVFPPKSRGKSSHGRRRR